MQNGEKKMKKQQKPELDFVVNDSTGERGMVEQDGKTRRWEDGRGLQVLHEGWR